MSGKKFFADVPKGYEEYASAGIVVLPVPYDGTSTWMKGADRGPDAIIDASYNMYLYDIDTDSEVYTRGIHTDEPVGEKSSPDAMVEAVRARVSRHLAAGKFVVTLGGEHSVTVGTVRAHAERHPGMSVLQLDAHADLQEEFHGSRYNHACVMARVRESCPIVQVGIRSLDDVERKAADPERLFLAEDIQGSRDWIDRAVSLLTEEVYVTIDLDAFDISIMAATGTPEPGGLGWYEVIALLKKVSKEKRIVGFDVVELCPNPYARQCDYLAAKLVYRLLSYVFRDGR
ncbi:MAG TPA: agmatinase [Spirochaetota bacterium]|nr:agmatinase [Spirochaetota bacterium]HPC40044.1 agmatinase [Spirochaetota bacterium]HPL15214.1 agmatinase [Spirochaetota bacterium]HQF09924.1 agmatinase [Spirochaetota bacterium]HQH98575.1 agmatinase [Spirochaetota bacterium]